MIHYGMTKAAQIAVARGLAEATAGTGITVNSVLPGPTRSRGVGDFVADWAAKSGKSAQTVENEFFKTARPTSLVEALRNAGGGGRDGGLRGESVIRRHQWRGAARRWRRRQERLLKSAPALIAV